MLPRPPKGIPGKSKQVWVLPDMPGWTHLAIHATFPWWISPCKEIDALLPETMIIRKSCNLIGREHLGPFFLRYRVCTGKQGIKMSHFRLLPAKSNDKLL